jgi:hypothetical protein
METAEWRVLLTNVDAGGRLANQATNVAGNAITYFGEARRVDGGPMTGDAADKLLECLHYFMSFCMGYWVPPMLPVGVADNAEVVWTRWGSWRFDSARSRPGWLDRMNADSLPRLLPGFLNRWNNPPWGTVTRQMVHWHVASNRGDADVEMLFVNALAGLELTAAVVLCELLGRCTEQQYRPRKAVDNLRELLQWAHVQSAVPDCMGELKVNAAARSCVDGPQAITEMRNWLVHPRRSNRASLATLPGDCLWQAYQLAMYYFDLALLHWFGYGGKMSSRAMCPRFVGEVVDVPWRLAGQQIT